MGSRNGRRICAVSMVYAGSLKYPQHKKTLRRGKKEELMAAKGKEQWICAGCSANVKSGNFFFLKGRKRVICKDCAAALQCKYPMRIERNPEYYPALHRISGSDDGTDYNDCSPYTNVYPVQELTAEQVKQEFATIDAYREQLRASFGGAENVFEVRLVHPLPKLNPFRVNIPNAIRYKNAIAVYGYVRLGIFHKGDLAGLRHGDTVRDITVLLIRESAFPEEKDPLFLLRNPDSDSCFHNVRKGISEGFPAVMVLSPDAAGVAPGDLIVVD